MRAIVLEKFDKICAHVLEYIENHTKVTEEEMERRRKDPSQRKNDSNIK